MADTDIDLDYVNSQINSLKSDSESAVGDLKAAALGYYNPATSQDGFDNNPDWEVDRGRDVALASMSDLLGMPELELPSFTFNPEDYISSDLLQRYSYDSDFFDNFLDSRLRDYIDSQSYFLAQEVQDALFEVSRQRDLQTLNDGLDASARIQARKGFPIPNDMLFAAQSEIIKKYQDTYADRNKEITALIADKSLQEKMHTMDTSIKMEDIRSRFQLEYAKLYWQAANYLIQKYQIEVQGAISEFQAQVELIKTKTSVSEKLADLDVAYEKMDQEKELARLSTSIEEMKANVTTWQESFKTRVEAAKSVIEYYKATIGAALGTQNRIDYKDYTG